MNNDELCKKQQQTVEFYSVLKHLALKLFSIKSDKIKLMIHTNNNSLSIFIYF